MLRDGVRPKGPRALGFKFSYLDAGYFARYGGTILSLNQWYFVAGVYDAAAQSVHLYLDGKLDDGALVGPVVGAFGKSTVDINIGRKGSAGGSTLFYGSIDEVRIYTRALSADEIAALYLE